MHDALTEATELEATGDVRAAVDLLSAANRSARESQLEVELVRLRRRGAAELHTTLATPRDLPVQAKDDGADALFAVTPDELDADAVREGWSRTGALHVPGLVPPDRVARLVEGIDRALAAYDASEKGDDVDPGWFTPFSVPSRTGGDSPGKDATRRRWVRGGGGLWAANSPRMLFELFELIDDLGLGDLMTDFLGERPVLSANKCTLRRVEPIDGVARWHQDGAFLGEYSGAFNVWLALTPCGVDAPGMDMVPRRFDHVLATGDKALFDWSLSDEAVAAAAGDVPIIRPEFALGDAVLFDHLCVHRTAAHAGMVKQRHAIEAWFLSPSHYPEGQLPLLY